MKSISIIVMVCLVCGCTSLRSIEMPPDQLQGQISAGEIVLVGERARLITVDGEEYKITVTAVTDGRIIADDIQVPIVDVVAVETRQVSAGKTTALVATGVIVGYAIGTALAAAALFGGL
jgi:hypothetical protein